MIAVRNILTAVMGLIAVGSYGQPLRCVMNAGVPPTARFEGLAELAGEVLLNCTGGTPAKVGATVPQSDVTIFLDANVTSRVLAISADTWNEALLMIDEPHSTYNPAVPLLACGDAGAPEGTGTPGVCAINGTGDGNSVYDGSASRPNVWQGRLIGDRSITWHGVPIDAPPAGGTRVIRLTNVRINPSILAEVPAVVSMSISLGGANVVPVVTYSDQTVNGFLSQTVAFIAPGLQTDVFSATSFQQNQSHNPDVAAGANYGNATADFVVRFREGYQSSFRQKNWGYSASTALEQNQNIPGAVYNTESYFENIGPAADPDPNPPARLVNGNQTVPATAAFPSYHGMIGAGEADGGTRLMLSFANVPNGVSLFVPTSVPLIVAPFGNSPGSTSGIAYLVATDSNGASASRVTSIAGGAITACSSNITGAGVACPVSTGLAKVATSGGSGALCMKCIAAAHSPPRRCRFQLRSHTPIARIQEARPRPRRAFRLPWPQVSLHSVQ